MHQNFQSKKDTVIYREAIDNITNMITSRFSQKDYKIISDIEQTILKGLLGESVDDELLALNEFYKDIDSEAILHELALLKHLSGDTLTDIKEVINFFKSATKFQKDQLASISKLVKLIMVLPASNATSERCFSSLRRVKTYLRSTMGQDRLNNLMLCHIYKEILDSFELKTICQDFVNQSYEHRSKIFGKF